MTGDHLPRKRVAIVQSSYVPWKGYFDLIDRCDELVLYDNVQYTRRDWRSRNRIKAPGGTRWLTIPVSSKGRYHQRIDETEVQGGGWARSHWSALEQAYGRCEHFGGYASRVRSELFAAGEERLLSAVNERLIRALCSLLAIATPIVRVPDSALVGDSASERLVSCCLDRGAGEYLSGPAARAYLDEPAFAAAGIEVGWMDYSGYPEYEQPFPPFEHGVSVLDLLFCTGPRAREHALGAGALPSSAVRSVHALGRHDPLAPLPSD